jgi:hypothetical protein
MTEEFTAEEDPTAKKVGDNPSAIATAERNKIEQDIRPNSFSLRFGIGHLSFEAENAVQIFAVLSLIILTVLGIVVSISAIWSPAGASWPEKAFTVIGAAISTVVGAIVGSAAALSKSKRK